VAGNHPLPRPMLAQAIAPPWRSPRIGEPHNGSSSGVPTHCRVVLALLCKTRAARDLNTRVGLIQMYVGRNGPGNVGGIAWRV
jgi:hypothetical protein